MCSREVPSTVTVTGDGEVVLDLEQDDDGPDRVRLYDGAASLLGRGWEEGSAGLMTHWRGSRWGSGPWDSRQAGLSSFITVTLGSRTDPILSDAPVPTFSVEYLLALQGPSQPVS